jgi:hypothetical protein
MELKSLNWNRFMKQILPSVFFIVFFALGFGSKFLSVNLIAGGVVLLLLVNIFLQNLIIRTFFGIIFILGSLYMTLALFDDIFKGKATFLGGYWVGFVIVIFSLAMSVLLMIGYEKQNQIYETENPKT